MVGVPVKVGERRALLGLRTLESRVQPYSPLIINRFYAAGLYSYSSDRWRFSESIAVELLSYLCHSPFSLGALTRSPFHRVSDGFLRTTLTRRILFILRNPIGDQGTLNCSVCELIRFQRDAIRLAFSQARRHQNPRFLQQKSIPHGRFLSAFQSRCLK